MKLVNGQCPRVCPNSDSKRSTKRNWLNDGVMTFAITQFSDIALTAALGACPKPNIPYPPLSCITAPFEVIIQGPQAEIAT